LGAGIVTVDQPHNIVAGAEIVTVDQPDIVAEFGCGDWDDFMSFSYNFFY
jgi:hypothetical protein